MTDRSAGGLERRIAGFRRTLHGLYFGRSPQSLRFQILLMIIDLLIIAHFVAFPAPEQQPDYAWLSHAIAAFITLDLALRWLASYRGWRWFRDATVWIDIFILITFLGPPWLIELGFLRVLRLWSLSRRGYVWRAMRRSHHGEWEDVCRAVVNLITFLFVATGFIYSSFLQLDNGIDGYIDALYFTVTTVTTTGYGDVILPGPMGKLVSIAIMIVGVSLFFRLAQAIVRPNKVHFPCPECALQRHDVDAVHCKACGHKLKIPDDDD